MKFIRIGYYREWDKLFYQYPTKLINNNLPYNFQNRNKILHSLKNLKMSLKHKSLVFIISMLISFVQTGICQDMMVTNPVNSDTTHTLFGSLKLNSIGLYVSPELQLGHLAGQFTGFGNGSVMFVMNQKLAVGAFVRQTIDRNYTPSDISSSKSLRLNVRNMGVKMEYSIHPGKLIHVSFPIQLGFGMASVDSFDFAKNYPDSLDHHDGREFNGDHGRGMRDGTRFGSIEPGINVNLNLFKYGKFFIGTSYRIAAFAKNNAAAVYQLSGSQLGGLNFNMGLKLGIFDYKFHRK
jgi:hypothetical protein